MSSLPAAAPGSNPARPLPRPPLRAQGGYLRRIAKDPQPVLDELRQRYGPVCSIGFGPFRGAIVGDPAALRDMFTTPEASFRWGHKFNVLRFIVGDASMIVSDGDAHRRRRSSVQSAFSRRRLNRWIPMIVDRCDAAVDRLEAAAAAAGTEPVDLYPIGRSLVFDIAVRAFFGTGLADRISELDELFQASQDYLESPAVRQIPHPLPFTARARVKAQRRAIDAIIDAEIDRDRQHPSLDGGDVIEALVADGELSDAEIRDQVVTLIGAGFHTTAASLAWMLWRAVLAPGIWEELRAEADEVFGGAEVRDESTLARLDLADRVMRETLRLHPAGVVSPREAATDVIVGGYRIPKGTLILWSAHLAGRDPAAWPDPLRFDPARFRDLDDDQRAVVEAAWVPFGRPPRNCIGFALAQMELTLIVSRLSQRLDLTPVVESVPEPYGMVVNRPRGGVPMRVVARSAAGA